MKKILNYFLVIVSLAVAVVFYAHFDLENILWEKREQTVVDTWQMQEDRVTDYTGLTPGEGVISLKTAQDWEGLLNEVDYATVTPVAIYETDVYSLAKWVGYYNTKSNGSAGRRRAEAQKTAFDLSLNYTPYYIIELEDGTRLLAQMNRGIARRIAAGEQVQLPLGQKLGFSQTAKRLLAPVCQSMDVSTDYVLYTVDNAWEAEHASAIFWGKMGASVAVFVVLAIILLVAAEYIFPDKEESAAK